MAGVLPGRNFDITSIQKQNQLASMNADRRLSSRGALSSSLAVVLTATDLSNLEVAMDEVGIHTNTNSTEGNDSMSDEDSMTPPPPTYIFGIELRPEDLAAIKEASIKNGHVVVCKVFRGAEQVEIDVLLVLRQLPQHPTRETKNELQKLIKNYLAECGLSTSRPSGKHYKKLKYQLFSC